MTAASFSSITNTVNSSIFPSAITYPQFPLLASPNASATVLPQAVLSIVKNGPAYNPQPGTQFTYEIVVSNDGSTSTTFDFTDLLPAGDVTFVSATANGGSVSGGASCVPLGICNFPTQNIGANAAVTYVITVSINSGAAQSFVNTGQIATSDATAIVATSEDTAVVTLAGYPDLFVTKSLSSSPSSIVQSGDTVQFAVTFGNS